MAEVEQGSHGGSALHPDQTAVYMTIHNYGHESDILLAASSVVATTAVFHTLLAQAGTLVMHPHGPFEILAGGSLTLHPGGAHIMLLGLTQALKSGEIVPVVLIFQQAGSLSVDAVVQ
jgi:copper(I)-binding protein